MESIGLALIVVYASGALGVSLAGCVKAMELAIDADSVLDTSALFSSALALGVLWLPFGIFHLLKGART